MYSANGVCLGISNAARDLSKLVKGHLELSKPSVRGEEGPKGEEESEVAAGLVCRDSGDGDEVTGSIMQKDGQERRWNKGRGGEPQTPSPTGSGASPWGPGVGAPLRGRERER